MASFTSRLHVFLLGKTAVLAQFSRACYKLYFPSILYTSGKKPKVVLGLFMNLASL